MGGGVEAVPEGVMVEGLGAAGPWELKRCYVDRFERSDVGGRGLHGISDSVQYQYSVDELQEWAGRVEAEEIQCVNYIIEQMFCAIK